MLQKHSEANLLMHLKCYYIRNTTMRELINVGHFSWGKNSTPGGAAKISTLLLLPKTGGDLGELLQFDP